MQKSFGQTGGDKDCYIEAIRATVGAMVRVVAFHQSVLGQLSRPSNIGGLISLVLYPTKTGHSSDSPVNNI